MENKTYHIDLTETQFKVMEELTGGIIDGGGAEISKNYIQDELGISIDEFNSVASKLNDEMFRMRLEENKLPYEDKIKENTYVYQSLKIYESDTASIEELQEFSNIVNFDRSMPAKETLELWDKYHDKFNK